MKVMVVNINNELQEMKALLEQSGYTLAIDEYKDEKSAQKACKETKYDIALLMPEVKCGGIDLGRKIMKANPNTNIIFISESKDLAYDAFECRPSGYLVKPVSLADIKNELANLRVVEPVHKLKVITFGEFQVLDASDQPVKFKRKISKEIFAYMIDKNGKEVATRDICEEVLNRDYDVQSSKFISQYTRDMVKDLSAAGYPDVVGKNGHNFYVDVNAIDCDYQKLLAGDKEAIRSYDGVYMEGYEWAEETRDELEYL